MSKVILTLAILVLFSIASATTSGEPLSTLWGAWKVAHNKQYSPSEESHRFIVFQQNIVKIAKLNAEHSDAKFAINKFADLTSAEFKQKYTGGLHIESHESENEEFEMITEQPLAASVDWRTKGVVTAVKDQGDCGSCWSFSAVAAIESLYKMYGGALTRFSEQQLVDCSWGYGNQGCYGGLMTNAFKYTMRYGTQKASDYPYTARDQTCKYNSKKALDVISGYKNIAQNSYTQLKNSVAIGPTTVALQADQDAFQFYRSGVLSSGCGANLNHAGLAVGYGSNYFIVKNSWGTSWGMNGYINIAMGTQNNGAGVCGINAMPSRPI